MHSASHIHADSCTSHTSFLIFIWFAPHGTFGLSADRDNIILIIVLLECVIPSGLKRKPTFFLRSSAISFFLSFNFNFNFLILIFGLVTSFPSRKAGLIMRRLYLALFRRRTRAVPIKFDCSTAIPRIQFRRRATTAPTVYDVWSDTLLIHCHNLCFQFVHGSGTAFKCHNRVVRQNSSNFKGRFFQPSLF